MKPKPETWFMATDGNTLMKWDNIVKKIQLFLHSEVDSIFSYIL